MKKCPICGSTNIPYIRINDYCFKHLPDDKRCTAITKSGKRCRNPIWDGTNHCKVHKSNRKKWEKNNRIYGFPGGRGPGYIYILFLGKENYYKIGQTTNINKRLSSLSAGNPWIKKIACLSVFNASYVEKKLHKYFEDKNIEREIFCLNDDDLENAISILEDYKYMGNDYRGK